MADREQAPRNALPLRVVIPAAVSSIPWLGFLWLAVYVYDIRCDESCGVSTGASAVRTGAARFAGEQTLRR